MDRAKDEKKVKMELISLLQQKGYRKIAAGYS